MEKEMENEKNIFWGVKEERSIIKRTISQFKEYNPIVDNKNNIPLLKINKIN